MTLFNIFIIGFKAIFAEMVVGLLRYCLDFLFDLEQKERFEDNFAQSHSNKTVWAILNGLETGLVVVLLCLEYSVLITILITLCFSYLVSILAKRF